MVTTAKKVYDSLAYLGKVVIVRGGAVTKQ